MYHYLKLKIDHNDTFMKGQKLVKWCVQIVSDKQAKTQSYSAHT